MTAKSWRRSRTVLFNIAAALAIAVADLSGQLQIVLGPESYSWVLICITLANILLRAVTTQPLCRHTKDHP